MVYTEAQPGLFLVFNSYHNTTSSNSVQSVNDSTTFLETSMDVLLVDKNDDLRLKELQDKAHKLSCTPDSTLVPCHLSDIKKRKSICSNLQAGRSRKAKDDLAKQHGWIEKE
ncbi:hypothetical protein ACFX13_033736 [Malus domestica]